MRRQAKAFFRNIIHVILIVILPGGNIFAQQDSNSSFQQPVRDITITNNTTSTDSADFHPSQKLIPHIKETIERYPPYYIYIFIGCFVLLAVIRLISPSYLRELLISVFNLKLLLNIFKEGRFDWNLNNFLLDVCFVLMFSIGLHQVLYTTQPYLFGWVLAFTAMAYFIKLIIIQLFAIIFFGRGEALVHLLMHTLFSRIAGLILLPVLFAGLYQNVIPVQELMLYLAIILGVCYALWLVRVYVKMKSISTGGIFYLFLYLCTLELSPIIILLKEVIV